MSTFVFKAAFTDEEWEKMNDIAVARKTSVTNLIRSEIHKYYPQNAECVACAAPEEIKSFKYVKIDLGDQTIDKIKCRASRMKVRASGHVAWMLRENLLGAGVKNSI